MKLFVQLTCALCLFPYLLLSQSSLSGIINDYTPVLAIDRCTNSVTVEDVSAFQTGDRVLLLQMQGATISTADNASFGSILSLQSAGLYEKGTIASIAGEDIYLENTLLHAYDITGKVQLVRVPIYTDAQIAAIVTGKPWDGTTGGVIAFEVSNTLEFLLGGAVDASAIGFRGGIAQTNLPNDCSWLFPQNNFVYPLNSWRSAAKGEGIAAYLSGQEAGKGPQANGGGGGNDHNSGGGGGGQLRSGGAGGINDEPSTFGCKGNHPGLGGRAIPNFPKDRVFMGGGGGAGHGNNNRATDGGTGGGIILISATNIVVNNPGGSNFIRSNGQSPLATEGDGAGGGGAGGDCLLEMANANTNGVLTIDVSGGAGGTINNQNQPRCHGPGGGGSGGLVRINGTLPSGWQTALVGGVAGISQNSAACPDGSNNAQSALSGELLTFDGFVESNIPQEALSVVNQPQLVKVCEGASAVFSIVTTGIDVIYQWEVDRGSGFQSVVEGGLYSGSQSAELTVDPVTVGFDGWIFRCRVSNDCFGAIFSQTALLQVSAFPIAQFSYNLSGATATFVNTSTNATSYLWDFGDGQSSNLENPLHTYSADGSYTVRLTVMNDCGSQTFFLDININTVVAPQALFVSDISIGCAPLQVQFTDLSTNGVVNRLWTFPGGIPGSSTIPNPLVTYSNSGVFTVSLEVSNSAGMDELIVAGMIKVEAMPQADFTFGINNGLAQFTNLSTDANTYFWDFGDGQSSMEISPLHSYTTSGSYTVTLTVTNDCGTDTFIQQLLIQIQQAPIADFTLNQSLGCTPLRVQYSDLSTNDATAWMWTFPGGNPATSNQQNPLVVYEDAGQFDVILNVSNAAGSNEIFREKVVFVDKAPTADFSYQQNGFSFQFTSNTSDAQTLAWSFGDGSPIIYEENPVHTYQDEGTYSVVLTASNTFCSTIRATPVTIYLTGVEENILMAGQWAVWPNPSDGNMWIQLRDAGLSGRFSLIDLSGRRLKEIPLDASTEYFLKAAEFPAGVYLLLLETSEKVSVKKVVIW